MKGAAFYAIGRIFAAAAFPISPTSAFFFTFDFFSFLGLIFLYKGAAPSIDINFDSSLPRVTPGGAGGAPSPQSEIMAPHARSMNFFSQQIDNVNNVNITSRPPPFLSTSPSPISLNRNPNANAWCKLHLFIRSKKTLQIVVH